MPEMTRRLSSRGSAQVTTVMVCRPPQRSPSSPLPQFGVRTVGTVIVSADEERDLLLDVLHDLGATTHEATIVSTLLLEADLRGQSSHGILRLPVIAQRARVGLI